MQDSEDLPQRRSALVARELARLDIDIAAFSKVRVAEQGSLREDGAGYTLFWSGKNKDEHCHNHLLAKPDDQAAKAAYKTVCSTLQAKLRTTQNDWWTGLAKRAQRYADMGELVS